MLSSVGCCHRADPLETANRRAGCVSVIPVGRRGLMSVCRDRSDRSTAGLGAAALTHTGAFLFIRGLLFAIVNDPKDAT